MATEPNAASKPRAAASNAVDRRLARYREMRDCKVTSEPSGKPRPSCPPFYPAFMF